MRVLLQGLRLSVVALMLHAALFAQLQPAPPVVLRGNHTVSGTVVNAITGDPIRRALVSLNERSMLTNGEGHFEFRNLPDPQGNVIIVTKPGFFNEQDLSQGQSYESLLVPAGTSRHQIVVKLTPEGVLTGQVESENGPVEGVQVNAMASQVQQGSKRLEAKGGVMTDEDGVFRIAGLQPGTYYLTIKPGVSQYALPSGNPPRLHGYAQSYYPGVPDPGAATSLEVLAGQEVRADFKVKLAPLYHISGTVSGVDPDAGTNLQVQTASGEIVDVVGISDDDQQQFSAHVPAGSYTLKARAPSPRGGLMAADLPIDVTGDLKGINLVLSPIAPIVVNVRKTSAARRREEQAVFERSISNGQDVVANVRLVNTTAVLGGPQYYASPEADGPNPKLVLKDVEPGAYQVELQPSGGWYVASAQCGNTDLLQGPLTVPSGSPLPPIEVELRDDGGVIQASAASEISPTAPSKTWVLVIPSGSPRQARETLAQGQPAIFPDVGPGDYSVLVFDSIDGLEYKNPEALREFMGRANQITVTSEQTIETKVELIQREKP
jgi:hypothetical protein